MNATTIVIEALARAILAVILASAGILKLLDLSHTTESIQRSVFSDFVVHAFSASCYH